jgi:hypothetical protein
MSATKPYGCFRDGLLGCSSFAELTAQITIMTVASKKPLISPRSIFLCDSLWAKSSNQMLVVLPYSIHGKGLDSGDPGRGKEHQLLWV